MRLVSEPEMSDTDKLSWLVMGRASEGLGRADSALLQRAAVMVSNDTGPGHLAAAVGTPLVSVLGPSDPAQWRAWGLQVHLVQGDGGWPGRDAVHEAVRGVIGG